MHRRRVLALSTAVLGGLAGCTSGGAGPGTPTTAAPVTTSGAAGIEFLVAQIAIPADATGPNAYYRVRNTAATDATIRLETVYIIDGGDTYRAFAVVTIPAGEEATVSYRIVAFDAPTDAEETEVRMGEADFVVVLNGEERPDV